MSNELQLQVALAAEPRRVFAALTENNQLQAWFCQFSDISLPANRYHFWGRYTPDDVPAEEGQNELLELLPERRITFAWTVRRMPTRVSYDLLPEAGGTRLILRQMGLVPEAKFSPMAAEDFWFLSLENLRRYLADRPVTRCDYRAFVKGDVTWSLDIEAPAQAVYEAIIQPDQLEQWIASEAEVIPYVGGSWAIGWKEVAASKILELIPNEKISFVWSAWGDMPATTVTWTLAESGGRTRLTLFHSGFAPDMDAPEQEGWFNYISRLRALVEAGPGWSPIVKALPADLAHFYPRAMIDRQDWLLSP